jgi:hypothetical protein
MALSQRDRIGAIILVGLFIFLGVAMYFLAPAKQDSYNTFEDNPIVNQRIRNLENSKSR